MSDASSGRLSRIRFQFRRVKIGRNVPDWGVGGCRNGDIGRVGYMMNRNSLLDIIERQDQ